MFKAEIKAETLKGIVYVVSTLVDEVKMTIRPDSVAIKAIDPAHVAMLDIKIGSDAFIFYTADEVEIGLDLDKVKSVLKLADGDDTIVMEHDPDQGRLTMKVGNITRRMSLVDTSSMNDPKVPQIDLSTEVKVAIDHLKKGIKASEPISDHISLEVDPEGFELACEGDTDTASLRVPAADLAGLKAEGKSRSLYPLDYFSNIVKVIPDKTVVAIHLDNNYPVKVLFSLAEGKIDVVYFLAPRIENE